MKILSNELAQHYQVASLQRGHSVFTSFISYNGRMLFLDAHLGRLLSGAEFLFPNYNWIINREKLKEYVESEFFKLSSELQNNRYFRLSIFDDSVHLQHRDLINSEAPLKLTSAFKIKTPGLLPAFVKSANYLESDLELKRAKLNNFDDVVYFDHLKNVTEASTSNLFIVSSDGRIITPAPSSMILDGVTRKKLFQKLKKSGFPIDESIISKTDLLNAREIWLTNSIKGIRFVDQFDGLCFEKKNSLFEKIVEIFGRYGELV